VTIARIAASNIFLDWSLIGAGNHSLKNRIIGAATGGQLQVDGRIVST